MSNLNFLSLDVLLITGRAVALVSALAIFAWGFRHWRRASERDTQRVFEQLDLVRADLLIMKEVMKTAAQRVDSAAKQVAHDVRLAPAQNAGTRGYEIAARLARSGAPKEELIKSCGITMHEAELLVRLHGRSAVQPSVPQTAAVQTRVAAATGAATPSVSPKTVSKPANEKSTEQNRSGGRASQAQSQNPRAPQMQVRSRLVAVG